MAHRTKSRGAHVLAALLTLLAPACGDDRSQTAVDAGVEDAGTTKPGLGGRLGAAVAAAASSARQSAAPQQGAASGPPEAGYFAPGQADAAHPPKTPPKVELMGEGSDPKVQLAYAPRAEAEKLTLGMALRVQAQNQLPTILFTLSAKLDRGDKDAKEKGKKGDKKEKDDDNAKDGSRRVRVVVDAADVGQDVAASKRGLAELFSKLKGSELRYELLPDGTMRDFSFALSKDADPQLDSVLRGLVDVLAVSTAPLPQKPVGVGAYWMTTDRSSSFDVDVVRYRVFKVEKIEDGKATLAIDTRQYAAKQEVTLGGRGLTIERFESQGKGSATLSGGILPKTIDLQQRLVANVRTAGDQGQAGQGALYIQVGAKTQ
jgi:hypothetical protein